MVAGLKGVESDLDLRDLHELADLLREARTKTSR